ncbi:MAG: histidine phosphatase family protein [Deltaproteobacteria bacterium]|nr:histidine phosphatase family protein [Deltaproteobacteria bacterium]
MAKKLYLVRHGQAAPAGVLVGRADYELTEDGQAEIGALRESLKKVNFSCAFVSPLMRTRQTLSILLDQADIPVIIEPGLIEISLGRWDGLTKEEIISAWPEKWAQRGVDIINTRPPDGESFRDLAQRVWPVFDRIKELAQDLTLVVSHQAVNRVILAREMNLPLEALMTIPQPTGAVTVLDVE